jgi:hypothetical protein
MIVRDSEDERRDASLRGAGLRMLVDGTVDVARGAAITFKTLPLLQRIDVAS